MSYGRFAALLALVCLLLVSYACQRSAPGAGGRPAEPGSGGASERALTRTLTASVEVDDVGRADARLRRLLEAQGGTVKSATTYSGEHASAHLELLVPDGTLPDFREGLAELGEIAHLTEEVEDVTLQRADLDARLENARAREARLRELLASATGNLAGVLEVERELSRAREDVERMDAERAALASRIAYATFSIDLSPKPVPLFDRPGAAIAEAFSDGLDGARTLIVGAVVIAATAGPTLVSLLVAALSFVFLCQLVVRRSRARRLAQQA